MTSQIFQSAYWACSLVPLLLFSCGNEEVTVLSDPYTFEKPDHFPEPTYTFDNNPVTKRGFELGKKLFFDPILSRDKSVSCNNCHQQSRAFADTPLHPTSIGVENRIGSRNAPSLANMAFLPEFFWDGGVTHLDFVPINAIESEVEMDDELVNVIERLNAHGEYPGLFQQAFGIDEITSPFMLYALSQFTNMMVSANAPYDQYILGDEEALSAFELDGLAIFEEKCGSCHAGELFTDFSYRNNGLNTSFTDIGRGAITESEEDHGKFRVPSLRNVELTPPYMHNARYNSLEEVLNHYDSGILFSATLDPQFLEEGQVKSIPTTPQERAKIIAFLKTLTDREFNANPIFRNNE